MTGDPNALAREEGLKIAERLLAIADEVGIPGSVAPALAIALEALKHIESALGTQAALVAASMLVGEFRKKLVDTAPREAGSPVPFALAQVETTPDGFAIACRSSAGVDEHAFADPGSAAETANLLRLLGWRLRFDAGTDAVRDLVMATGRART